MASLSDAGLCGEELEDSVLDIPVPSYRTTLDALSLAHGARLRGEALHAHLRDADSAIAASVAPIHAVAMQISDPLTDETVVACSECLTELVVIDIDGQWWCGCTWEDRDALSPVVWLSAEAVEEGATCATCAIINCKTEFLHGEWCDVGEFDGES